MSLGSNASHTSSGLWTEALATPTPKGGKVKIKKSDIIKYPIFLQGAELVTDDYWRELIIKCAKGKFPRGFAFQAGFLLHHGSGISIQLPDDPTSLVNAIVLFMRQKGNIYSPDDLVMLESIANQYLIDGEDANVAWDRIYKGKDSRAVYIRDFIERTYVHLSRKIRDEYFTQVNIHLELNLLRREDIVFAQGQIQSIDGFTVSHEGVLPNRDMKFKLKDPKPIYSMEKKPNEYLHYENWVASMQDYHKYIMNSQSMTVAAPTISSIDT